MDAEHLILAGALVGWVIGLTGVGGGSLMTPLLIFGFGVHPHLAVGTDLLFAAGTKAAGTWTAARARRVPWRVVGLLSAGSLPAAGLMLLVLQRVGPGSAAVQHAMTTTLGVALLLTASATLYKVFKGPTQGQRAGAGPTRTQSDDATARHPARVLALGALIGALVTLTSVGAGAIGVTALMLLYPRLPLARVVAADVAYAVPLTLVAGLGHAGLGSVDWGMLGWLLAGSLPGIWLGTHWAVRAPERGVRTLLAGLLTYAGARLVAL